MSFLILFFNYDHNLLWHSVIAQLHEIRRLNRSISRRIDEDCHEISIELKNDLGESFCLIFMFASKTFSCLQNVTKLHKHAFQIANTECAEQSDQLRTKFMEIHMFLRLLLFLFVFYGILNGSPNVSRTTSAIFELFFQNNTFGFHVRKISQL